MKLDPCKFCGGAAGEPRDDQIEINSWTASIDCSGCDATLTMQYTCDTPAAANGAIVELWNSKPGAPN
ncbi:Lar family restriction alleviation protein [Paraburkholderia tropica]|uniref:Lar family restriction alleviation protein n=1 Tax=Paraburkholderia tropica TaxID=92647 RepID=UPI002AB76502|nr:Lar family restriction alleviation protein [Paraburkholderia tropica]